MPERTRQEITEELNKKVEQYKELDDMLRKLNKKIHDSKYAAEMLSGHEYSAEVDKTNAIEQRKVILGKYGQEFQDQLVSFFEGPEDMSDNSILDWICKNYVAVRLFTSSDFLEDNPVKGLYSTENKMHDAARMAKMFLLKYLPDPEAIYWGDAEHVPEDEDDYSRYMEDDFRSLEIQRESYLEDYSLETIKGWIKPHIGYVPKEVEEAEQTEPEEQAEAPDLNEPETDSLASFAKELKDAKTTFNSDEYKAIISFADNWENAPKAVHSDSPAKDKAAQLVCIKTAINAYLNHKGKDGVKKNVYKKLAAVEKLNQFVSEKLKGIKEEDLPSAETKGWFKQIKEDLPKDNIPAKFKNADLIAQKVSTAQAFGIDTNEAECARTLKCMDKIIRRSENRKDELWDMQKEFFNNPGNEVYSSGKLAAEAITSGIRKATLDKSTKAYYDDAIKFDGVYEFDDKSAAAYNYAKKMNLDITLKVKGKDTKYSWKSAESLIESIAKKAKNSSSVNEARKLKGILYEDFGNVNESVKEHLKTSEVIRAASRCASAEYNDKELIEKWPDINLQLSCYKKLFSGPHDYRSTTIDDIIDNYNKLEDRMAELAKPHVEKMKNEKLQKTDTPEKQKSKAHTL